MTLHDAYCLGLAKLGCEPMPKRNKYTMFVRPASECGQRQARYFFVGTAGALRHSRRANAATSVPCSDALKTAVLCA